MNIPSSAIQGQLSFGMEPLKEVVFTPRAKQVRRKKKVTLEKDISSLIVEPESDSLPSIMTVSQVTKRVARLLEEGIGTLWVEGEISNYRKQSSGHHYFTLKDSESQIACVLFARAAAMIPQLSLADGMMVQLYGEVTVYQPRGQYQLLVRLVQRQGAGLLQARFEALKQKLAAEGLFDAERKRLLPRFPKRIGIVTSPTGAALADFLHVLHRRHPGLQVVIYPVRVQGQGAAEEIKIAIEELNTLRVGPLELIVLARGGGSLEDLWAFNEEVVVRAIAASTLPIVSGVGHEIDFTLSDFAADLRAPTPSAAAELIAADSVALLEQATSLLRRIAREMMGVWEQLTSKKKILENAPLFRVPERFLSEVRQHIDDLEETLQDQMERRCEEISFNIEKLSAGLRAHHPKHFLVQARQRHATCEQQLEHHLRHHQELLRARLENLRSSLAALSPRATLARGFTITRDEEGRVLTSAKEAAELGLAAALQTEFADGMVSSNTICLNGKFSSFKTNAS
ncbi:MAG: exodeoxyribonuclease VII large subunit [Chthoniobacterales bacterium]